MTTLTDLRQWEAHRQTFLASARANEGTAEEAVNLVKAEQVAARADEAAKAGFVRVLIRGRDVGTVVGVHSDGRVAVRLAATGTERCADISDLTEVK